MWVIAGEKIEAGRVGDAVYRGMCTAQVDIRNGHHTHARFRTDGDTDAVQLWSDFGGLARIAAGEEFPETGDKWCQLDMRCDSVWIVEGFLAARLDIASVETNSLDPTVVDVKVWQRDATGALSVNTGETVELENVDDKTKAPGNAYARVQFNGFAWTPLWLGCAPTNFQRA